MRKVTKGVGSLFRALIEIALSVPHMAKKTPDPLALSLVAVVLSCASIAQAGSGQVMRFPRPGPNASGLVLRVDPQWVEASGYRDVRIHISTANGAATPRDRNLRIELSPNYSGEGRRELVTTGYVTLPQGATAATAHILVPQHQPWYELSVESYEGGRLRKELSGASSYNNSADDFSEAVPSVLVISAAAPPALLRASLVESYNRTSRNKRKETYDLPDIRALESVVQRRNEFDASNDLPPHDMEVLGGVLAASRFELLPPADLPEQWIGFSSFDLVVVPLDDLQQMAQRNPATFQAIVDWTSAEGNLLVYDVGNKYERLGELEELCRISPATADGDFAAAGWKPSQRSRFSNDAADTYQSLQQYGRYYGAYEDDVPTENYPTHVYPKVENAFGPTGDPAQKFLTRPLGMGQVIAMGSSNPFPASTIEWSWVLNSIEQSRSMWYQRHGMSLRRQNNDYWEFLIPNTGRAPVVEFCILITLFAVLIGPVNYYVLARKRRLYLLLATIPLGAAAVTISLFAYALIYDGLGTKVRMRSYTQIDQSSGRAACWSRQSYYAGIAPSRGLTFPEDTAVYPVQQFPTTEYDDRWRHQRTLAWDDGQHLRSGYMSSRVASQFLAIRAVDTKAALFPNKLTAPTEAANRLHADILMLLVCDKAGDFYWAENVAKDATANLAASQFAPCKDKIYKYIHEHHPSDPEGFDPDDFHYWYGRYWYAGNLLDNELAEPRAASSLMETNIRRLRNAQPGDISKGSYIAIMKTSPIVPIGVAGAREHDTSIHIIEGKF